MAMLLPVLSPPLPSGCGVGVLLAALLLVPLGDTSDVPVPLAGMLLLLVGELVLLVNVAAELEPLGTTWPARMV